MLIYLIEGARLILPGMGVGFLISALAQGFAQPWWTLGMICCVAGTLMNLIPCTAKVSPAQKERVINNLGRVMTCFALVMVLITVVVKLFR